MPIKTSSSNVLSDGNVETTLGGRIFKCRERAGLSVQMLANLTGVRPSTLKSWESDRSEPRVNKLVAMAGILGVSPTYFIAEEGNSGVAKKRARGRGGKLISNLKAEMAEINEQQKILAKHLRKINTIIQKL
ncbi:helix-turn-helix domain-containing protein [Alphaproteobacteria bacterium LSUCC0684]